MRRMLDPTKVGGIPSTITFDKDGNRTADKDLKVNGKLKLQSLVSSTNPDGDITKELGGGGELHGYAVIMQHSCYYIVYTPENYNISIGKLFSPPNLSLNGYDALKASGDYIASGYIIDPDTPTNKCFVSQVQIIDGGYYNIRGYYPESQSVETKRMYPDLFTIIKLF